MKLARGNKDEIADFNEEELEKNIEAGGSKWWNLSEVMEKNIG